MLDYPYNLGVYSRTITTSSAEAQVWFDRGLNWSFGYNHDEAAKCFRNALAADADCAMAYWGIAYVVGPNYNKPWKFFDDADLSATVDEAVAAAEAGLKLADRITPVEVALLRAIRARYATNKVRDDLHSWNDAYADAMRQVYRDFPNDPEVATLFAEALMNRTPWAMWDIVQGTPAERADTVECRGVLEKAMAEVAASGPARHPGLLHLYIHLMEMSPFPEVALNAGAELRGLVPDAGHLQHMPTHIEIQCGEYQPVVDGNSGAIVSDRKYVHHDGAMNFYTMYRSHNYHFNLYGAMFLGRYAPALRAAEEIVETVPDELVRVESPPMADFLEAYLAMKPHVLIRFGKWQALIDEPLPDDQTLYVMRAAMLQYGKGIAHAVRGEIDQARRWQAELERTSERMPESRYLHTVPCRDICGVARAMLAGELEYRTGNHDVAFTHLRRAVVLEDALPYDEPWGWMQPTRHALGALLLEQGKVDEALQVYREDLGFDDQVIRANRHYDNVWGLRGYHECLVRLGRTEEAALVKPKLDIANARADVTKQVSCLCRLETFTLPPA
jgi:tetratricopeptide (TPR) repeat protein